MCAALLFQMKVTSPAIARKPSRFVHRTKKLQSKIAQLLTEHHVGKRDVELLQPQTVVDRNGKALPTRISRIDGKPMGVAGVWAQWTGPDGEVLLSYALLTVNANSHALLHRYQQPGAEKRMPAILNEGAYDAWLNARVEKAREFMRQYPSNWLTANPVERKADKRPPGLTG